jgi:uncharacterized protein (UPF0261 family)
MAKIAVLGTLDTKGAEHGFVAELIRARGHEVVLIDVGSGSAPTVRPDVSREEVAAAGGVDLVGIQARQDRGEAVTAMSKAAGVYLAGLVEAGEVQGVISLGGGGGTAIGTAAMRELPVGFPKVMVSTLAAGNVAPYVGTKDIVMFPSIVDVSGVNRLSRVLLSRAAGAVCGMVEMEVPKGDDRPLIAASMFGNTTECVNSAREILEGAGYEVLVFHSTGMGGREEKKEGKGGRERKEREGKRGGRGRKKGRKRENERELKGRPIAPSAQFVPRPGDWGSLITGERPAYG